MASCKLPRDITTDDDEDASVPVDASSVPLGFFDGGVRSFDQIPSQSEVLLSVKGAVPGCPPEGLWRELARHVPAEVFSVSWSSASMGDGPMVPSPYVRAPSFDVAPVMSPRYVPGLLAEREDISWSPVMFKGHNVMLAGWGFWCAYMLGREVWRERLEALGLVAAVEATYKSVDPVRDISGLTLLLSRWSSHTHTFITEFGEIGLTLLDVVTLTGLPMHGTEDARVPNLTAEERLTVKVLHGFLLDTKLNRKGTYSRWIQHFYGTVVMRPGQRVMLDDDFHMGPSYMDERYELAAFLAMFLSSVPTPLFPYLNFSLTVPTAQNSGSDGCGGRGVGFAGVGGCGYL
ncbi:hypothetical protein RJ640_015671 [Escallonia rubra]|uniref:Aminotransferase-like plant mobile domain-containing protein n=1 Tax=Escallonia rubra TaxID=112253 RepID=A0AA88R249_9ASTE|nr:hypothetical protein RJ640_015671 [Escallonia rubra]